MDKETSDVVEVVDALDSVLGALFDVVTAVFVVVADDVVVTLFVCLPWFALRVVELPPV